MSPLRETLTNVWTKCQCSGYWPFIWCYTWTRKVFGILTERPVSGVLVNPPLVKHSNFMLDNFITLRGFTIQKGPELLCFVDKTMLHQAIILDFLHHECKSCFLILIVRLLCYVMLGCLCCLVPRSAQSDLVLFFALYNKTWKCTALDTVKSDSHW